MLEKQSLGGQKKESRMDIRLQQPGQSKRCWKGGAHLLAHVVSGAEASKRSCQAAIAFLCRYSKSIFHRARSQRVSTIYNARVCSEAEITAGLPPMRYPCNWQCYLHVCCILSLQTAAVSGMPAPAQGIHCDCPQYDLQFYFM